MVVEAQGMYDDSGGIRIIIRDSHGRWFFTPARVIANEIFKFLVALISVEITFGGAVFVWGGVKKHHQMAVFSSSFVFGHVGCVVFL